VWQKIFQKCDRSNSVVSSNVYFSTEGYYRTMYIMFENIFISNNISIFNLIGFQIKMYLWGA
jgi:hypothetical protein